MYCTLAIAIYVLFVNMVIFDGPLNKLGGSITRLFKGGSRGQKPVMAIEGGAAASSHPEAVAAGGAVAPPTPSKPPGGFFSASPSGRNWKDMLLTLGRRYTTCTD